MNTLDLSGRSRRVGRLAVGLLAVGLVIAVLAFAFTGGDPDPATPTAAGAGPNGEPSGEPKQAQESESPERHFPGPVTDPRTGRDFCTTITLLGWYAETGYGLDPGGTVVSGRDFQRRLVVIAGSYGRLAQQAATQDGLDPAVRGTAPRWRQLARATSRAEETLRSVGLQVQSQPMVVALARLARTSRAALPAATAGLQKECGIDPAHLGV